VSTPLNLEKFIDLKRELTKLRKTRRCLKQLSSIVSKCLVAIDAEMALPSTPERGKKIALICNALDMANDQARCFARGINYRTDRKHPPLKTAP
jgi:hypothetical protein